ncbi:hypothetical protein [Frankia sp. Cas3]|uniref:hypothetical protein n=1 Tax=Frankia sp. Cas3 TaxID=3073926 RepID=UPI003A101502
MHDAKLHDATLHDATLHDATLRGRSCPGEGGSCRQAGPAPGDRVQQRPAWTSSWPARA